MLVTFGSALFVLIPLQISTAQESSDAISRVIQGIAAGVGFLGAGEIVRESQQEPEASEDSRTHLCCCYLGFSCLGNCRWLWVVADGINWRCAVFVSSHCC